MEVKTCGTCKYFSSQKSYLKSRKRKKKLLYTCSSLGINPDSTNICDRYSSLLSCEDCANYPCKLTSIGMLKPCSKFSPKSLSPDFQAIFGDIFISIFKRERDANIAIDKIREYMEQNGFEVPLNNTVVKFYMDRISSLYFLSRLIDAFGLSHFKEDIIKAEIARSFSPRPASKPS